MSQAIHEMMPVMAAGTPLGEAKAVIVAVHGRGANAQSILQLASAIGGDGIAYIAPQAHGNTWYPQSFLAPYEANEPFLSSALNTVDGVVQRVLGAGHSRDKIIMMGFSQGACLASEYVARHAAQYGGLIAFSGGLIGPPGAARDYEGTLDGTPVFLGCSDVDFHIPLERVQETTRVLESLGGSVDERIYPNMGHTINDDELEAAQHMVAALLQSDR